MVKGGGSTAVSSKNSTQMLVRVNFQYSSFCSCTFCTVEFMRAMSRLRKTTTAMTCVVVTKSH